MTKVLFTNPPWWETDPATIRICGGRKAYGRENRRDDPSRTRPVS